MTQIWPLFLKKTGLKESEFQTVAGDGQTKLNAVINGQADLLLGGQQNQPGSLREPSSLVVSMRDGNPGAALEEIEQMRPMLSAMKRGAQWILAMQNSDGGWGAFDRDNTREIFTRVPFADHNAMIDPSTADLTSRMLEMFADLGMSGDHPVAQRAMKFIWREQESDGAWFGRWGVNYLYGTWQTLVGLQAIGVPASDPRMRLAVNWLKSVQQPSGGWGETIASYDEPKLRGSGTATASQTAWAVMGLCAFDDPHRASLQRGIEYLTRTQNPDGSWTEHEITGTGFPTGTILPSQTEVILEPGVATLGTARIVNESTDHGGLYHMVDAAEMRAAFAKRNIAKERAEWLYNYDPLTVPLG